MKPEEVSVIRADHDATSSVMEEAPVFEPGYQPEQLPKLEVPNLDAEVQSLSASELAQVPTLVDQVGHEPEAAASAAVPTAEVVFADAPALVSAASDSGYVSEPSAQEMPVQADHLFELFQVRMDTLVADIKKLNDRLDQLEIRSKV